MRRSFTLLWLYIFNGRNVANNCFLIINHIGINIDLNYSLIYRLRLNRLMNTEQQHKLKNTLRSILAPIVHRLLYG